ncbi:MAG: ATP-dependent DNA helicase [Lachnospiraceae bacterium]|nr:ATP-dependent DNA helicase [Lachnospiraceae bacterium]
MEVRISVRNLVEFLLRSGDIDNRRAGAGENAMQEGSRIHRMLQKRMGPEYEPEVFLRHVYDAGPYQIVVEGRADGIITDAEGFVTIDEIKTTYKDIARIKEPVPVHLAQAKVYAAIYGIQKQLKSVRVRMSYCNVETEELTYFHEESTTEELEEWLEGLLKQYKKWADYEYEWRQKRRDSIAALEFPFAYREGQKELVSNVYRTIYHKKKLFIEAPTGVGKTISTVFPSVKAMENGMADKIFYLTAKTITRTVAENTFALLRERGLQFKSVVLTAKEKICFMEEVECNPDHCPYAKGHFDRINDAVYDLLLHSHSFTREIVEEYAKKHRVCPFEFCLDMSLFADGIICDYNYVFDPHVYLRRFFGEGVQGGSYLFLVDEAHNLLERGREMYSAVLYKEAFLELKKEIRKAVTGRIREFGARLERQLEKCNKELLLLKRECEDCRVLSSIDGLTQALVRLRDSMDEYLDEHDDNPIRKQILDFFFDISHFLDIYERVDDNYVKYSQLNEDDSFFVKLFCVNPALNLRECMERGRSTILFSATLLPIQYYKRLLGGEAEDYEVYARSIFNPEKKGLYLGRDVTTKYSRRSEEEFFNIARYIHEIIKNRHGNYMVFFPSHAVLSRVYDYYQESFAGKDTECVIQEEYMDEVAREAFLTRFEEKRGTKEEGVAGREQNTEDVHLIGFCVMGGIFGEGIDLKHDSLIGVIVVGTGIPQVCHERELLKRFFDAQGENGFDYAYRFPGMNKVLQAAGRVIRTAEDVGIVALLDERFLQYTYQKLFPREWEKYEVVNVDTVAKKISRFWDEWL